MQNKEKALVLGANGFIGSHVVDSLAEKGYSVRAFGTFGSDEVRFGKHDNVELFAGNFLNQSDIREALDGVDYVFHLISTTTPVTAEADPLIDIETNIKASVELFQQCVAVKSIKRVIYSSSGGTVYGERKDDTPIHETDPTLPVSPYGIGKLTVENYLRYFKVKHGLESTVLRIANPYGEKQPKMRKQGVIPIFLEKIINHEPITILGDGSMVRDYIYVKDIAEMMVETLSKQPKYDVYNLGSGRGHSLTDIIETINRVTDEKIETVTTPVPSTFVHTSILNTDRFFSEFGETKMTDLEAGIRQTYQHLKSDEEK